MLELSTAQVNKAKHTTLEMWEEAASEISHLLEKVQVWDTMAFLMFLFILVINLTVCTLYFIVELYFF
jgi:cytochrome c biogenesis protein ResB